MGGQLCLQEFSAIEAYQHQAGGLGLNRWDARPKLALLIVVSALNVIVAQGWLSLSLWLAGLALVGYSRIPWRLFALFLLAPAWATLVVVFGFALGFGSDPLLQIGPFSFYRQGMMLGLSAAARVGCEMTWMAAVLLTTPVNRVISALAWFRLPQILLEALALTYRYIFLLFEEFQRMLIAARSRGGMGNLSASLRSMGMIVAQVFLRSYDRSRRIQAAILARGGE